MKVLVTGAHGQVGVEVVAQASTDVHLMAFGSGDLDVTDVERVASVVDEDRPDVIINCAAYTNVDGAESEVEAAFAVNRDGCRFLADAAERTGSRLIHVSTDYVFDGRKAGAYDESDATNPLGVYGESKLAGEQAVSATLERHVIVRVAWVFGRIGRSFVDTMIRLARERDELRVVDDQHGTPTPAVYIAEALWEVARRSGAEGFDEWGLYHYATAPVVTWFEFAEEIIRLAGDRGLVDRVPHLVPVTTDQYPTTATRPRNSVLGGSKLDRGFGIGSRSWQTELRRYLAELT